MKRQRALPVKICPSRKGFLLIVTNLKPNFRFWRYIYPGSLFEKSTSVSAVLQRRLEQDFAKLIIKLEKLIIRLSFVTILKHYESVNITRLFRKRKKVRHIKQRRKLCLEVGRCYLLTSYFDAKQNSQGKAERASDCNALVPVKQQFNPKQARLFRI